MPRSKKIESSVTPSTDIDTIAQKVAALMLAASKPGNSAEPSKRAIMAKAGKPVAPFMTWTPVTDPTAMALAGKVKAAQAELLQWARNNYAPADGNSIVQVSTSYGRLTVASVRSR